jgi:glucokinase
MPRHREDMSNPPTHSATCLAIEIGGTKLQIVQGDGAGRICRRWRAGVERGRGGPGILEQLRQGIRELTGGETVSAIAVGFGGPVDHRTGRICKSHQIEGWDEFPLADWLRDVTGTPTVIENDANAAALGEALCGAGRGARAGTGADPLFYVTLGSGVGGGLVVDERIYHGATPGEAEFGHVRLDRDGTTVESRCSGWAVDGRIRRLAAEEPTSFLARSLPPTPGGEAKLLGPALAAGDPAAGRVVREVAADLAFALSHAVHLFHPRMIVLGGGLALVGESLRTAVAAHLPLHVMEAFSPGPEVRLAALGEDAVPVGALCLAASLERET